MLPNDACVSCGTLMVSSNEPVSGWVGTTEVPGLHVPHLRCPKCGETMFTIEQARDLRLKAEKALGRS